MKQHEVSHSETVTMLTNQWMSNGYMKIKDGSGFERPKRILQSALKVCHTSLFACKVTVVASDALSPFVLM